MIISISFSAGIAPFLFPDHLLAMCIEVIIVKEVACTMKSPHRTDLTSEWLTHVQNCISKSRKHVSESRKGGFAECYLLA